MPPPPPQQRANPRRGEERHRGQPHRYLSAADGDAAAAQGAVLRSGDAAARRQGPDPHRRRFHRHRGSRRADGAHRPHGDAAMRAGAAPADGAQQGGRGILQRRRRDLEQSRDLRAVPGFPRSQPRAGGILRARIQAEHVPQSRARSKPSTSPHWRSAATASPSTTSPTCGSSRANSPTAACVSSRCRPRCCSTRGRPRRPTSTPRTCPTCSAASASTLSPSGSRASVRWSTCSTMTCGSGRDSCSQHLGRCGPRRRLLPAGPRTSAQVPNAAARPAPDALKADPPRATGNAALARRAIGPG